MRNVSVRIEVDMKKRIPFILILAMMFLLSACGTPSDSPAVVTVKFEVKLPNYNEETSTPLIIKITDADNNVTYGIPEMTKVNSNEENCLVSQQVPGNTEL